ncbi:helicase HerA domain-containing protein [Micromonospora sp. NBC_01638]|uniref:helicase HerA domain-containing protein n=1 Tax=Micromonospora sp. NBC_01638 TaxID=2975982 RepID=UPI00386BAD9A|nr:type IV secretion system DNA-binding domain-containing protein [Micromonospora sp. NBC_01638]
MSAFHLDLLDDTVARLLVEDLRDVAPGHCVRLDDIDTTDAIRLANTLTESLPRVDVHVLQRQPSHDHAIDSDRAVELRNRKRRPLLLLVPAGEGHAASSLDNSFKRLPLVDLLQRAGQVLDRELRQSDIAEELRILRAQAGRRAGTAAWASFLAAVEQQPDEMNLGRQLWRLGLIPDHGPAAIERLARNAAAATAIAHARRPTASVSDRLVDAGLRDSEERLRLRAFLESKGSPLSNATRWTKLLGDEHSGRLTFECWPLVDDVESELTSVVIAPFIKANNALDATSKLKFGADGQLICQVPEDSHGTVAVKWTTDPPKTSTVANWLLEVLPPEDARSEETSAIGSAKAAGSKRRATVKLNVTEDDLAQGSRFVVRLQALDSHGDRVLLSDGAPAEVDSQEFEVVVVDGDPTESLRTASATSLPEAVLRAAVDGLDDRTEDLVTWDLPGQVFSVRLGNRRVSQIRVSDLLVNLQRRLIEQRARPSALSGTVAPGTRLEAQSIADVPLELPRTLGERRGRVLQALAEAAPRDTAESIEWTDELRQLVASYLSTYRRALDTTDREQISALLRLDTLTVHARTAAGPVSGVVILPLHPLRLAWIATHDDVFRRWAAGLDGLPRSARPAAVDLQLAGRVTAANLPFVLLSADETPMVYDSELTHGTALYLPVDRAAAETAADVISAALGIVREGAQERAASDMVLERIAAFRAAHPGGSALRLLAVNPGSGRLLAGALRPLVIPGSEDAPEGQRLEVVAYTDQTSFTDPMAPVQDLQRSLRLISRAAQGSHLSPPLSLAVRATKAILEDETGAHLAVVQNLPTGKLGLTSAPPSRSASFRDLLTPTTTHAVERDGRLVWRNVAALRPRPANEHGDISATHRAHQGALARWMGDASATPSVDVTLNEDRLSQLRSLHERTDWVLTVDRFLGLNLYEDPLSSGFDSAYLLDYAPDFVEGMGERLSVTTSHRAEVAALLASAMRELGLAAIDASVGDLLETLSVVSGRLALRLLGENTLAREAVSLGALVMHLRQRGELDGVIVIPVDAHPEIFGPTSRDGERARRCDLLLVRVGQRSFRIECVEVKARREAFLPQALADRIADQLMDTRKLLQARYFATDPPRVDGELQRARLANLLHYYADRASVHKLIDSARLVDIHRYVDRIEEQQENPDITMRGYVIALDGDEGFPRKHRDIPMAVLTAQELGRVGFTTQMELSKRDELDNPPSTRPEPGSGDDASTVNGSGAADQGDEAAAPNPGVKIPLPADDDSADGADGDRGHLNTVEVTLGADGSGLPATWRVSTKGSPHAFIIGIPGQGKSVTTRKIIRDFASQGLPALVFDFHGDMAADPPAGAAVINATEGLPFNPLEPRTDVAQAANNAAWEIAEIMSYVCGLGEIQRNHVYKALQRCYAECGWEGVEPGQQLPNMSDFAAALEEVEAQSRGRNARDRLRPLTDFGLFRDGDTGSFNPMSGGGVVVDVSGLGLEQVQLAAGAFLLRKVYREMFRWGEGGGMRLAVVLDEAHRLAKDVTLPKLMKEGRKYGISVVVASQGLEDFRRQVLENAGTKIVFRTNFPASKAVAGYLRGRAGQDLSQQIEQLGVGQAYVATPDEVQARRIYMNP